MRQNHNSKFIGLMFLFGIIFFANTGHTGSEYKHYTKAEMRMLPPPIEAKLRMHLGDKSPKVVKIVDKYTKYYGWGYFTLHHYAKGVIYIYRINAMQFKYNSREFYIKIALGELSFSLVPEKIKTFSKRFKKVFLPEIYTRRGEVHLLNNDYANAALDFKRALQYNKKFGKAYLLLSRCYQQAGDAENAQKMRQLANKYRKSK